MPLQPAAFRLAFALHSLAFLLLLTPTGAEAGTFNPDRAIGDVVPPWTGLVGTDGREHGFQAEQGIDRRTLSALLERYFTSLFRKNVHNMKWKKFFYKQLCDRAEIIMCPARSCQSCVDYKNCFESEGAVTARVMEETH